MSRLLFEKTGNAVWISHLDLMRVMQRAFRRAGLLLKHTGGFNQHAYVSLALPLSVGTESFCEILDYDLDTEAGKEEQLEALNRAMPEGIRVRKVYDSTLKFSKLVYLRSRLTLEYDAGVPENAAAAIGELFHRPEVLVEKHTKSGMADIEINSMIRQLSVSQEDANTLTLELVGCAQNPSLNPMLLPQAVTRYLPELKPDHARCTRLEVLQENGQAFR